MYVCVCNVCMYVCMCVYVRMCVCNACTYEVVFGMFRMLCVVWLVRHA